MAGLGRALTLVAVPLVVGCGGGDPTVRPFVKRGTGEDVSPALPKAADKPGDKPVGNVEKPADKLDKKQPEDPPADSKPEAGAKEGSGKTGGQ